MEKELFKSGLVGKLLLGRGFIGLFLLMYPYAITNNIYLVIVYLIIFLIISILSSRVFYIYDDFILLKFNFYKIVIPFKFIKSVTYTSGGKGLNVISFKIEKDNRFFIKYKIFQFLYYRFVSESEVFTLDVLTFFHKKGIKIKFINSEILKEVFEQNIKEL